MSTLEEQFLALQQQFSSLQAQLQTAPTPMQTADDTAMPTPMQPGGNAAIPTVHSIETRPHYDWSPSDALMDLMEFDTPIHTAKPMPDSERNNIALRAHDPSYRLNDASEANCTLPLDGYQQTLTQQHAAKKTMRETTTPRRQRCFNRNFSNSSSAAGGSAPMRFFMWVFTQLHGNSYGPNGEIKSTSTARSLLVCLQVPLSSPNSAGPS
ncbi:hypothetical protein BY458DRAFT_573759 [Sporodiniella umbellata]|nr:hypothetical protein BY458DRAFT_573759 [Sporodiniella umbellata]